MTTRRYQFEAMDANRRVYVTIETDRGYDYARERFETICAEQGFTWTYCVGDAAKTPPCRIWTPYSKSGVTPSAVEAWTKVYGRDALVAGMVAKGIGRGAAIATVQGEI